MRSKISPVKARLQANQERRLRRYAARAHLRVHKAESDEFGDPQYRLFHVLGGAYLPGPALSFSDTLDEVRARLQ